jgi:hypothetical protein
MLLQDKKNNFLLKKYEKNRVKEEAKKIKHFIFFSFCFTITNKHRKRLIFNIP